jgi:hypothetical protein
MDERTPGCHGDAVNGDRILELATKTVSRPMPASIDILDGTVRAGVCGALAWAAAFSAPLLKNTPAT